MKITATIAKTRAAMEKQNARRTSRVILLPESRVARNNLTHMLVKHTLYTLLHGQKGIWYLGHVVWVDTSINMAEQQQNAEAKSQG